MSPCYTHTSDHMRNELYAKSKIGFVDGTISMLRVDSSNLYRHTGCNATR
ncbi:hypothetical protein Fmac_005131 [Flemingia macrophylla]|uniref:Uncharacterized protein n=1 Tax=Flemingia macrophylla TaxID=520843 RepID=A0ABD1N7G0_9FABA